MAPLLRDRLPPAGDLPRYVAPLPRPLENLGFRLVWPIVAANLAGTAFGFWYYRLQFEATPVAMWPLVPDSPAATLFIGLALALWALGRQSDYVTALAFFGCIKLGLWTPYVQLAYADASLAFTPLWLWLFLIGSHLAMAVEAFLLHRVSDFPVRAVAVATGWFLLNDVVDYFVPVIGEPHHTRIPPELVDGRWVHDLAAHDETAAVAVALTVAATFLAMATRVERHERA